jgi:hypothetical protein
MNVNRITKTIAIIERCGEPTPFLPASYLWHHPDFRLICTTDKISLQAQILNDRLERIVMS